jgi:hypothetical protein
MQRIRRFLSTVTSKKNHVEFFTALLSIPVLLTVILLNLNNLNQQKKSDTSSKPNQIIISLPAQSKEATPIPTKAVCKPGLGTVTIANPHEGDIVSDNPVNFTIYYDPGDYCAAVWSYRINGGRWSDYDDKSIALYDLPSGDIKFDLRVKSVVSGGTETTLTRNITYKSPKATISPTATVAPSPTQQPVTTSPTGTQ